MKKNFVLGLALITSALLQAQDIEKTDFTEGNVTREAFGFTNPVCNKEVLVDVWKNFIKQQGGKVKGGIVSKVTGTDIQFSPSKNTWNGYFAYSFEVDNTFTIFTSFQNIEGEFITSDRFSDEAQIAKKSLLGFQLEMQRACNQDDLNNAKKYSNSLSKEKIRNSDRIMSLEKSIQSDTKKIELKNGIELTEKEQLGLTKMKQRIVSNESEIQTLQERNNTIDEELKAQNLVVQGFQDKQEELNYKNINNDNDLVFNKEDNIKEKQEEDINDDKNTISKEDDREEIPTQKEKTKKFFDK